MLELEFACPPPPEVDPVVFLGLKTGAFKLKLGAALPVFWLDAYEAVSADEALVCVLMKEGTNVAALGLRFGVESDTPPAAGLLLSVICWLRKTYN